MQEPSEKERFTILMEEMRGQFKAVLENQSTLVSSLEFRMNNRFDLVEKDLSNVKLAIKSLSKDVAVLKSDVKVLKSDVAVLKSDVKVLKSDVTVLKSDVKVLKSDVGVLKSDVKELQVDSKAFKFGFKHLTGEIVDLKSGVNLTNGAMRHILEDHEARIQKIESA